MLEYPKTTFYYLCKNKGDITMDNKQATPIDLAYLAGLMDGEGCIMITKSKISNKPVYNCQVKITNTDVNLIEKIQSKR